MSTGSMPQLNKETVGLVVGDDTLGDVVGGDEGNDVLGN